MYIAGTILMIVQHMKQSSYFQSPFHTCGEKTIYDGVFDPQDIYITFRSRERKPTVVDQAKHIILKEAEGRKGFYAGCWAWLTTGPYLFDKKGNNGVAFGLVNIQKVRDDEPLTVGGARAEDEFDTLLNEMTASDDLGLGGDGGNTPDPLNMGASGSANTFNSTGSDIPF